MATEISLLIPQFRSLIVAAIAATRSRGFVIEPYLTLLSPMQQAAKWRQGRSGIDAELKMLALDAAKAPYLSLCMKQALPLETNLCTDDLPGYSWLQWGEEIQVVWVDGSRKLNFSPVFIERPSNQNGYVVFKEECVKLGIFPCEKFSNFKYREGKPTDYYTIPEIDSEMKRRYGR